MNLNLIFKGRCTAIRNTSSHRTRTIRRFYMVPFAPFVLLLVNTANATAPSSDLYAAVPSEQVRIRDLDLQTRDGWRRAKSRVSAAATRVCASQPAISAAARCHRESVARAEQDLLRHTGADPDSIASNPATRGQDRHSIGGSGSRALRATLRAGPSA